MLVLAERFGSSQPPNTHTGFPGFSNGEEKRHPRILIVLVNSFHICVCISLKSAPRAFYIDKGDHLTWQLNVASLEVKCFLGSLHIF